jgi:hypothetical protein
MRNRLLVITLFLALGIVLALVAAQRPNDADSGESLGSSGKSTPVATAELAGAAPARRADAPNDAVDCVATLMPTGQALPSHADITEVVWERAGELITYEIRFATEDLPGAIAALERLNEGDFIGFNVEFLDPEGSLPGDSDTGWMPDRMGNLSLNLIRDPVTGAFFGARFEVNAGSWQQIPAVEYQVEMTADSFILTVPASAIPSEAKGFVASILFDASASEIFCDLAAIDEDLLRQQLSPNVDNFISGIVFNISAGRDPTGRLPYLLAGPDGFK